jgi:hypothetical protein
VIPLVIVALLSANPHASEDYPAPMGLRWGMTRTEAKKVLEQRCKRVVVVKEAVVCIGPFAGFDVEGTALLFEDGLSGVAVKFRMPDPRPASQRWFEFVEALRKVRGNPTTFEPMPGASYAVLDRMIETGEWSPSAAWVYRNAEIRVSVAAGTPDRFGSRGLQVTVLFALKSVWTELRARAENDRKDL